MFTTVLVANRGEIACRVLRAAHALGYRTVSVATPPDADAPHAALADRCVHLADPRAYLDADALIDAARRAGADALHPGYGFLSERADFARAVIEAGLTWIGPPPAAIAAMGDKAAAKARMRAAGVPVLPGTELLDPSDADLRRAADAIGFPLLVKASAGGGGRGLRKVVRPQDLDQALASARAEAHGAFGDGRLLLERLVTAGRHVEVQVLADAHGAVIHLGERDCSAQRRHQKVIEEAPSPAVSAALRAALGEAACAAARSVEYVGAGTVEMLLEPDGRFWFLEMNTRLQVEHPVTELVTGLDLVALQLRVAAGEPLPLAQGDVALRGHAIEARLYAEDPAHDFRPATGPVLAWSPPAGEGVRVDHGLVAGQEISPHYDPMVAKLIAWGPDRATATRRLRRALREATFLGPATNLGFLDRLLACETWTEGQVTTAFLDADAARPLREAPLPTPATTALAAALWLERHAPGDAFRPSHRVPAPLHLARDGARVITATSGSNPYAIAVGDSIFRVALRPADGPRRRAVIDGTERPVDVAWADGALHLAHLGERATFTAWDPSPAPAEEAGGDGIITAPTAGTVRAIPVEPGARVAADAVVAVVEAMKIETPLRAGIAGVVAEIRTAAGAAVRAGQVLVIVQPEEESP